MKHIITLTLILFIGSILSAQITADFDDIEIDSFLNQAPDQTAFDSKGLLLYNNYVPEWQSWDGWALSSTTDTETIGFANQYSSISGGYNDSDNYAVSYIVGSSSVSIDKDQGLDNIDGLYVTNNTYAYYSILEGDDFAKKFGGITGDDPDFFRLTIYGYREGTYLDSLEFYLADYRFEDNSQDYVISDWNYVDVSSIGEPDSLEFFLSSSDNGLFGMNTPAYFCMDDVEMSTVSSTDDLKESIHLSVYPNPVSDRVTIAAQQIINSITLVDASGQEVKVIEEDKAEHTLSLKEYNAGIYTIFITSQGQTMTTSLVKY